MGKALNDVCKDLNKTFKNKSFIQRGLEVKSEDRPRIPFSSPRANYMTYGGIPKGKLIEFYGPENSGKTTSALDLIGQAQKLFKKEWEEELASLDDTKKEDYDRILALREAGPKKAVFIDCEFTFDEYWAHVLGVDLEELLFMLPEHQTAEEVFDAVLALIGTGEVGLVVLDSLAGLISSQEFEKDVSDYTYAGISAALTKFCKKLVGVCSSKDCTFIGINQLRDDMNNPYNKSKTPGGRAWKFFCSIRLGFHKGSFIDEAGNELKQSTENPAGNQINIHIEKSKSFKSDRRNGFYSLNYTTGVWVAADLVDVAVKMGIIEKSGPWFKIPSIIDDASGKPISFQGRVAMIAAVEENDELREVLEKMTGDEPVEIEEALIYERP